MIHIKSAFLRLLSPGYSWCGRCGTPWKFTERHETNYTSSRGMFPLCESCWVALTPEERLPYYRKLYLQRTPRPHINWGDIQQAVLKGK